MLLSFARVVVPEDVDRLVEFLGASEWPFHGIAHAHPDDVRRMEFVSPKVSSFWAQCDDRDVGLIRLLDLDDTGEGSPLFDLRIAETDRGRGVGTACVAWLTGHLLTAYPRLHRVEATTRDDNVAMQRTLERSGYQLEGRLRESWLSESGVRHDTLVYGILRTDWGPRPWP